MADFFSTSCFQVPHPYLGAGANVRPGQHCALPPPAAPPAPGQRGRRRPGGLELECCGEYFRWALAESRSAERVCAYSQWLPNGHGQHPRSPGLGSLGPRPAAGAPETAGALLDQKRVTSQTDESRKPTPPTDRPPSKPPTASRPQGGGDASAPGYNLLPAHCRKWAGGHACGATASQPFRQTQPYYQLPIA
eukprot:scaffold14528_cov104-Isochrysis_galbana.AAC.4